MHLPIVPIWIRWIKERWLIPQRTIPHIFSLWLLVESSFVFLIFIFFFQHSKIRKKIVQGCAGTPEVARAGQLTAAILDFLPICQSLILPQNCAIFLKKLRFFFSTKEILKHVWRGRETIRQLLSVASAVRLPQVIVGSEVTRVRLPQVNCEKWSEVSEVKWVE